MVCVVACAAAGATYRNPIACSFCDPAPVEYRGEYYLYQSGGKYVHAFKSRDLVNWTYAACVFTHPQNHVIWAPEMHVLNGRCVLYISDLVGTCYKPRMRVAMAAEPLGPFELLDTAPDGRKAINIGGCIDPNLFISSSGDHYLLGAFYPGGGDGCGESWIRVWKLSSALSDSGAEPLIASKPLKPWEWIVNEGPEAYEHKGQVYVLYAANGSDRQDYCTGCLRTPLSTLRNWSSAKWAKSDLPVLAKRGPGPVSAASECGPGDPGVWGPGHGMMIKGPNGFEDWFLYHRKRTKDVSWARDLAIDRVFWMRPNYAKGDNIGDILHIDGPTDMTDEKPARAPSPATFADCFDAGEGTGKTPVGWRSISGTWSITPDGSLQQSRVDKQVGIILALPAAYDQVAEVWVKLAPGQSTPKAGLCAWSSPSRMVMFAVGAASGKPAVFAKVISGSQGKWVKLADLPQADFDVARYHKLRMERAGGRCYFWVDCRRVGVIRSPEGIARTGLFTEASRAEFDGFRVTNGFLDAFEASDLAWTGLTLGGSAAGWKTVELKPAGTLGQPEWRVLRQDQPTGRRCVFRAGRARSYEFSVAVSRVELGKSPDSAYGIYSCYADSSNYSIALVDPAHGWLSTFARVKDQDCGWKHAPLPASFDASLFNTIRVVKEGDTQSFYVNNALLQTRTIAIAEGQIGLITQNARADYDDVLLFQLP